MERRRFLHQLGVASGAALTSPALLGAQNLSASGATTVSLPLLGVDGAIDLSTQVLLPNPQASGIEHIVVVTMENRSFDHFFGSWLPGADGITPKQVYPDRNNAPQKPYDLAPDYEGCGHPGPDHAYDPDRVAYDGGKMDGFLKAGSNDIYAIGFYRDSDIPFYSSLARNFLVCQRYFASTLGPTFPNRMFLWAAQTDRLDDSLSLTSLPTIFDRLSSAGVSHRYYFNNVPYVALWGFKYFLAAALFSEFLTEAAAGTLPAVSFVDPNYTVLDDGTGNDDHPHADIRNGDTFLATIYRALTSNVLAWQKTVLIITFDEWGGFLEHVAPPRVVAPNDVDKDRVNGKVLLGFRVPVIVASPFTQNSSDKDEPRISDILFDHTSILKLIEWRWGLPTLTARDASPEIGNLAAAFNFNPAQSAIPSLPLPAPVVAQPCFQGGIFSPNAVSSGAGRAASTSLQRGPSSPRHVQVC